MPWPQKCMWEDLREEKGASGQGIAYRVLFMEKVELKLFLARQCCVVARRIDLESGCLFEIRSDVSVLTWEMGRIMLFPQGYCEEWKLIPVKHGKPCLA